MFPAPQNASILIGGWARIVPATLWLRREEGLPTSLSVLPQLVRVVRALHLPFRRPGAPRMTRGHDTLLAIRPAKLWVRNQPPPRSSPLLGSPPAPGRVGSQTWRKESRVPSVRSGVHAAQGDRGLRILSYFCLLAVPIFLHR